MVSQALTKLEPEVEAAYNLQSIYRLAAELEKIQC
jgi:hypothetical protein